MSCAALEIVRIYYLKMGSSSLSVTFTATFTLAGVTAGESISVRGVWSCSALYVGLPHQWCVREACTWEGQVLQSTSCSECNAKHWLVVLIYCKSECDNLTILTGIIFVYSRRIALQFSSIPASREMRVTRRGAQFRCPEIPDGRVGLLSTEL